MGDQLEDHVYQITLTTGPNYVAEEQRTAY